MINDVTLRPNRSLSEHAQPIIYRELGTCSGRYTIAASALSEDVKIVVEILRMIGNSAPEHIFIHACIFLLRSVAPLSVVYNVKIYCFPLSFRLPRPLEICALAETLWYFAFYLYRKNYLQRPAVHPPLPSREKRRELSTRCFENIPDYDKYISKWFLDASLDDIKRENIKDFFRWAFFNTAISDSTYDAELDEYVKQLEELAGRQFSPGRGDAKCLRLTFDKAHILHRSLIWYLVRYFISEDVVLVVTKR